LVKKRLGIYLGIEVAFHLGDMVVIVALRIGLPVLRFIESCFLIGALPSEKDF